MAAEARVVSAVRSVIPLAVPAALSMAQAATAAARAGPNMRPMARANGITLLTAETTRASAATGYFPAFLARVDRRGASINALVFLGLLETATVLLTISPTLGRQFQTLIDISTILTLVMYGWCAIAALRISGRVASPKARLGLRACAVLGLGFCVWTSVSSDLKLLLVSLGFLVLTVPLWLAVQVANRGKAARAAGVQG